MRPDHPSPLVRLVCAAPFVLGGLAVAACDSGENDPPDDPPGDEVVAGVNLTQLFAPPTDAEEDAVRATFAARDAARASLYDVTLEDDALTADDGAELHVYAVRESASGDVLAYGAVRLPDVPSSDVRQRPVLLVLPEDGPVDAEAAIAALPFASSLREDYVYAVVAYRGQALTAGRREFTSPADPAAAYDLDTDDALALLDAVRTSEDLVEREEVGVFGYGRGGGVALLVESRPSTQALLDLVVELAGPTDFFLQSVRDDTRAYLTNGSTGRLPAFGDVATTVLAPLRDGGLTPSEARLALLRRSPRYFTAPPPFIVAAHGLLDSVVPVGHGDVLDTVQGTPGGLYLRQEEASHSTLLTDQEVVSTVTSLLGRYLPP